ncbi:Protein znrd2 [Bulinus truncatus]|nr:Protein znrd2 [Bulinus truncatus]
MDLDDWQPPTEAELKIIKARQERSNKISQLMSTYLLKGYKMLGSVCSVCETIMLQDKQGVLYCVACSELDSDGDKDNPVINQTAASSLARELSSSVSKHKEMSVPAAASSTHSLSGGDAAGGHRQSEAFSPSGPGDLTCPRASVVSDIKTDTLVEVNITGPPQSPPKIHYHSVQAISGGAHLVSTGNTDILIEKVNWACQALQGTTDLDHTIRLCQVIKVAAEAIEALKKANIELF